MTIIQNMKGVMLGNN